MKKRTLKNRQGERFQNMVRNRMLNAQLSLVTRGAQSASAAIQAALDFIELSNQCIAQMEMNVPRTGTTVPKKGIS